MSEDGWTVAGAKARPLEVIQRAQTASQTITRNGTAMAVVVSADEWARKTARRGSLTEFLLASPLLASDLNLDRISGGTHDLPL